MSTYTSFSQKEDGISFFHMPSIVIDDEYYTFISTIDYNADSGYFAGNIYLLDSTSAASKCKRKVEKVSKNYADVSGYGNSNWTICEAEGAKKQVWLQIATNFNHGHDEWFVEDADFKI